MSSVAIVISRETAAQSVPILDFFARFLCTLEKYKGYPYSRFSRHLLRWKKSPLPPKNSLLLGHLRFFALGVFTVD